MNRHGATPFKAAQAYLRAEPRGGGIYAFECHGHEHTATTAELRELGRRLGDGGAPVILAGHVSMWIDENRPVTATQAVLEAPGLSDAPEPRKPRTSRAVGRARAQAVMAALRTKTR